MFRRFGVLGAFFVICPQYIICLTDEFTWPLSASLNPDLPQSSPFGPRQKASENFRYDFHRGVDIPTPTGTPAYAIADGVVRLAGNYEFYTDTVVQIRHETTSGGTLYANYLHMLNHTIQEDDVVTRGQVIGHTAYSESGFEHLHFEIREGGVYQRNCVNPWKFLPYENTPNNMAVTDWTTSLTEVRPATLDVVGNFSVSFSQNSNELDWNQVRMDFLTVDGETMPEYSVSFDIAALNLANEGDASLLDTNLYYNAESLLPTSAPSDGVFNERAQTEVFPAAHNSASTEASYVVVFHNVSVPTDATYTRVSTVDVFDDVVATAQLSLPDVDDVVTSSTPLSDATPGSSAANSLCPTPLLSTVLPLLSTVLPVVLCGFLAQLCGTKL